MKTPVTSKGQVTIPKHLRDRFGIDPGVEVAFVATDDGIRLRKVVNRQKQLKVFGCLKAELEGHAVKDLLDELRGPVELPQIRPALSSASAFTDSRRFSHATWSPAPRKNWVRL